MGVVIGMDPHKRTVTIEVMDADEQILGHRQFTTDVDGFDQMLAYTRTWPERVWAVEGCAGIGRHVAERLVLRGGRVVDVPAKLSARMRMFATGQGRKTDDTDAHSIALVGVRITGLHQVVSDEQLEVLRLLVEVADITRFPDKGHFASWTGTAPVDVSSGDHPHHRLSRGGNREINRVLHMMAVVQLRNPTEGRAYYDRKKAEGKSPNEAMRALKRRLSDVIYRTMLNDYVAIHGAGSGGHRDAHTGSDAAGSQSHTSTSKKSLPEPADPDLTTPLPIAS